MIPKIIHYCWFGMNPKPKLARKCINSWKKKCPDYEIIEWNEHNFDISSSPLYVRQAYEAKKWAFVTDYVRLKVVYDYGGIYLDTDVELVKRIDPLLNYHAYFGFQDDNYIATGLGFGAEKGSYLLKELLDDYNDIPFVLDNGEFDMLPCPNRNTPVFIRHGLIQNNNIQILDDNVLILPSEYLCPISYWSLKKRITKNTISIHWFSASWQTKEERDNHKERILQQKYYKRRVKIDEIIHLPNRFGKLVLGEKTYNKLKKLFKRGE